MSLRSFHILFIAVALGLLVFLEYWSGSRLLRGEDGQILALAISVGIGLLAGVPYLAWFVRKTKSPRVPPQWLGLPLILALPRGARACAVCFGADSKDLSQAYLWSGVLLLSCVFLILGGLSYFVYRVETRR